MRIAIRASLAVFGMFVLSACAFAEVAGDGLPSLGVGKQVLDENINFGVVAVGGSSTTTCYYICWNAPSCSGSGTLTLDNALAPPFSAINLYRNSGGSCGTGTPVNFPVFLSSGQKLWLQFRFAPTSPGSYSDTMTVSGLNFNLTGSTSGGGGGSCVRDADTACLLSGRFKVEVTWTNDGGSGNANLMYFNGQRAEADQSAFFYFQGASNFEMGVKMVNACGLNSRFWVFASGLTDQGWTLRVTDTSNGTLYTRSNANHHLTETLADTSAFATCP